MPDIAVTITPASNLAVTVVRSDVSLDITGSPAEWYSGAGAPASGLGVNGDHYLNTTTGDVYKKLANTWTATGNIKGATGPSGSGGAQSITATAGSALSSGRLVRILDGEANYYTPGESEEPNGVTITAASLGAEVTVVVVGPAEVAGWGLTPGALYYANENGTITDSPPATGRAQQIGVALDSDTLTVNIQQPIIY
jgi:hypothetical protein